MSELKAVWPSAKERWRLWPQLFRKFMLAALD